MKSIKFILFCIIISLFVLPINAMPITKFGATQTGSIGVGNGYYNNELGFTNTSSNRNIYIVTEPDVMYIVEPLGYPIGISSAVQLVAKGAATGDLKYGFVASDGYLYFTDSQGVKRKTTRSDNTLVIANDTGIGGDVLYLYSGTISKLFEFEEQIYFFDGTNLKSFSYPDYTPITVMAGVTQGQDFSIVTVGGEFTVFVALSTQNTSVDSGKYVLYSSTASNKNTVVYQQSATGGACGGCSQIAAYSSIFITSNYIYTNFYSDYSDGVSHRITQGEKVLYRSNYSVYSTDGYTAIHPNWKSDAFNLGGYSVFAMYAKTTTTYDIFSFVEIGVLNVAGAPAQLTYTIKTIESLQPTYYNRSDIYLEYNVVLNGLDLNNILLDLDNYRWMISMTDPNGVTQDIIQSPACWYDSLADFSCQVTSTMGIHSPVNGWLQGIWYAKLYEINIVDPNRALIATSSAFTVLNTSLENQSIIPPAFIPPTSGTAPQAIGRIDGFVSWLGLGVNSVSKFLFAGIIIVICGAIGFMIKGGSGNIAMVFAFLPYAFFTMIDYIPKWVFIITIILMAIVSKAFR